MAQVSSFDLLEETVSEDWILLFLIEAFPDIPIPSIESAFVSADRDFSKTIDFLANGFSNETIWCKKNALSREKTCRNPKSTRRKQQRQRKGASSGIFPCAIDKNNIPTTEADCATASDSLMDFRSAVLGQLEGVNHISLLEKASDFCLTCSAPCSHDNSSEDDWYDSASEGLEACGTVLKSLFEAQEAPAKKIVDVSAVVQIANPSSKRNNQTRISKPGSADVDLKDPLRNEAQNQAPSSNPSARDVDLYNNFRNEAQELWNKAISYYNRARDEYSKGNRAFAGVLAETGREYKRKANEADFEASYNIFEIRNRYLQPDTLDLHCLHVNHAVFFLKERLEWLRSSSLVFRTLNVITGCGQRGRIKNAVLDFLRRSGFSWIEENPGKIVFRIQEKKI